MPTLKKRINITVSDDIDRALKYLAKRDKMPQASKATALIREALELEEDAALYVVAEKRDTEHTQFTSHGDAWQ